MLARDTRRYADRRPWPRWWVFQALLWLSWRTHWRWALFWAGWWCSPCWAGWTYNDRSFGTFRMGHPPWWVRLLERENETPF